MSSNKKGGNSLVDRKEAVGTTILDENKSVTKDSKKGTDELAYILLFEKKSSTNDFEKVTD